MFLTFWSPRSSKAMLEPVVDLIAHRAETQMPPGLGEYFEARGDVDAVAENVVVLEDHVAQIDADAELDPSRRRHIGIAAAPSARCTSAAHVTASTTLWNSTSMPSPVVLMIRPRFLAMEGSMSSRRWVLRRAERPSLVDLHQPAIADHVGGKDRFREPSLGSGRFHFSASLTGSLADLPRGPRLSSGRHVARDGPGAYFRLQ